MATYNVENLFDAVYDGTEYDIYIPGKHNWDQRTVEIKLNHTAEVICDLDADILGLQEVENSSILRQLLSRLDRVGCPYRYSAISRKKGAAIQVALLSRYPVIRQREIQVSYSPRTRNILEVEVDIKGDPLTVFVNHWKSKAYQGYESKRIAYAKALQSRIAKMPEQKEYLILGDFNSDYNVYLTLEEKLNDTRGRTAFNDVLRTRVGPYLVEEEDMAKAEKGVHYTLWKELPVEERWSHKFFGKRSSMDQIVLPGNMFDGKGVDYVNNSFRVFKAPYLFTKKGYINRWEYKNGKHRRKGYSDHLPVYAYFDRRPYKGETKQKAFKTIEKKRIDDLYAMESLQGKIHLEDVTVLLKRGRNAVVKQHINGRGIYLYGCADPLKEGHTYDLLVESIKSYKGLKEITTAYKLKEKAKTNLEAYYLNPASLNFQKLQQNEVIRDMTGLYKNGRFHRDGKSIPIHFKKRELTPKNGSRLKIHYGHIGYYKELQLVIYSKDDFEILE
ncbi:MAG TPA: endonuclease/exonuclease/phosphatase family protein [Sulfurovum sp.]|uniref:endonuclease/exonuclease/phosphatase family protein n=1 Tax=Sulfurovum sp. TaxID=1969726 RepID=UPI002F9531B1